MMKYKLFIPACSLLASVPLAAASISVNIASNEAGSTISDAGILSGAIPIDGTLWNNVAGASGTDEPLTDDAGAAAGSITWTSANTWRSGSTGSTATSENGDLTKGYLDDGAGGWTVTLNSPYLLNDIYIIHGTDQGDPANLSAISVNGTFYKGDEAGSTILASGSGDSWSGQNWTDADALVESTNYLKVMAQTGVTLRVNTSSPGRGAISGVQIENAYAGTLSYWDIDGVTPGAGGAAPSGNWGDANWSTSAAGDAATANWSAGNAAIFSAGSDAIDPYTITLAGSESVDAVWVQNGLVTLTGGTLALGSTGVLRGDDPDAFGDGLVVDSIVTATDLSAVGSVTLNNAASSITGTVNIGGFTTLGADFTFTKIAGAGIFNAGSTALTVGDATDSAFGGDFEGDGTVDKVGAGTVILGSPTGFFGAATVSEGTLGFTEGDFDMTSFTGTGGFAKSGGGQLTVFSDIATTGPVTIDAGTLQLGGVSDDGSIDTASSIAINGGLLSYRHDVMAATITVPLNPLAGTLRQQSGDPTATLTVSNTLGTDTSIGTVDCRGGTLVYASGAVAQYRTMALQNGNQTVEDGASVTAQYLNIGNGGSASGILNQTGGTLTMEAGSAGIRIGHWGGAGRELNVSGGTLDATDLANNGGAASYINMGWDGEGDMTVGGGAGTATVKAAGLQFDRNRGGAGSSASTATVLPGGVVEVGSLGIVGQGDNDGMVMSGGLLRGTADSVWRALMETTTATTSSLDVNAGVSAEQSGEIFGDGALTKTGAGTLVLSGASTYTGALSVTGGTLRIDGDPIPSAGSVTVASGGTIGAGSAGATGSGTLTTLDLASGSASAFRVGPTGDQIVISGADGLTTAATTTISVQPVGAVTAGDVFPVIDYDGTIQGAGFAGMSLAAFPNPHYTLSLIDNAVETTVDVEVTAIVPLTWTGPGAWNLTNSNWNNGGGADMFYEADIVTFSDLGATESVVVDDNSGADPIAPASMTFDNTLSSAYTISGDPISGVGGLTKTGDGTIIVTNDNTYTGITDIQAGTVQIGDAGTTGSIASNIIIDPSATLVFDRSDAASVAGQTITGGGMIIQQGAGELNLNNAGIGENNFEFDLDVTAGTSLTLDGGFQNPGAQSIGTVNIGAGATVTWNTGGWGRTNPMVGSVVNVGAGAIVYWDQPHPFGWIGNGAMHINGGTVELRNSGGEGPSLQMTGGLLSGTNTFRSNNTIVINASADQSTISAPMRLDSNRIFDVADGAATPDLLVSGTMSQSGAGRSITKAGDGTMVLDAASNHDTATDVLAGTLALGASGSVTNSTSINVVAGATFDVTAVTDFAISATQTLSGNGTLDGSADVAGAVAPGASAGTLTVTGAVTFDVDSFYNWEVSDWTGVAGTGFDTMVVDSLDFTSTDVNRFTVMVTEDAMINFSETDTSFVIASTTSGITNFDPLIVIVDGLAFTGAGSWLMVVSGNDLVLEYTAGEANDYDTWATDNGYWTPGDPNTAPGDDFDGDGVINDDEYAFGLDPTDPASVNPISAPFDPASGTFSYTRRDPALSGWSYDVETSPALMVWTEDAGAVQTPGATDGDGVQTVVVQLSGAWPSADPAGFVRVQGSAP